MKFSRIALIALIVITCSTAALSGAKTTPAGDKKLVTQLQEIVKHLVEGTGGVSSNASIDLEAYVIDGTSFESLIEAARGHAEKCRLIEGVDSKMVFQQMVITDDRTAAFIVMKTHSTEFGDRFHSVVFFKEAQKDWKIKSWHISM